MTKSGAPERLYQPKEKRTPSMSGGKECEIEVVFVFFANSVREREWEIEGV